ncbi:LysR family transcriptional regulator [Lacticaseibacillus jixianensis]|uniref:LysR family transcriptional regulator n=1 Tax=Lacticaseibacillus jixianensis TaxID=2486012 RepID=A0ABW4B6B4_9LACO|nr:LysR family transcriptional regulator [Lacticaseibacillus jixianensis]
MNTRDLAYFEALTKLKNFSQVANQFGVTQPTITMALKRLEAHFGIQLIDRDQSHAQVTVTPAGTTLAAHVQVITAELTAAEAELARARSGKIRFGLPPIIGNYYFPTLAPALMQAGLIDQLQTVEAGSQNLLSDLRTGHLDGALLGSTGPLNAPALVVQPLRRVPFTIVVANDHPLAAHSSLRFADLKDEPFVTLAEGFVHTKAFAWFTRTAGIQPSVVYRTQDVALLKHMVQAKVGVALLAEMAVLPADHLKAIPLTDLGQPTFDIALVTSKTLRQTPAIDQLLTLLKKEGTL